MLKQEARMGGRVVISFLIILALCDTLSAADRRKLDGTIPYGEIMNMDPAAVDPSGLPLTPVESMHSTGTYRRVETADWRLTVRGPAVSAPLALTYEALGGMPMVKKRAILICPGFFYDYLEWEGVPLATLLEKAGVTSFSKVSFTSVDGYSSSFTKAEVDAALIMIAIRGNGVPLPRSQGYPARVVAEDVFGGRWVKYLSEIVVK
jgi:DMSO/TMAO reductase YedYZ molybdopterin-dependent catalytic subunit